MPIFLFNYTDKMMHGIFRAITPGTQNINPQGKQCCNIGSLPCMHVDLILYAYMSKQKLASRSTCFIAYHPLDVAVCLGDTTYRVMGVAFETPPTLFWLTGWTSISHTSITRYPAQVKVELFEKCRPIVDRCTASSTQVSRNH